MSRIVGVTRSPSLLARLAFHLSRRRLGKIIQPLRVYALHTGLLLGYGQMERAQEKARRVPVPVKSLAQIRIAMLIGCPF